MQNLVSTLFERFGLNAYALGDLTKAEKWFRRLEAREPDSLSALRNIGVILLAKGDAEGASQYLLKEEKRYGRTFQRHAALADLAYARGKRAEAAKRYALALAEPECAPGGSSEAIRPLMEKRLAICSSEDAFARTREAMAAFEEAQTLRFQGNFEEAVARFLLSARLDETNWPALNNVGSIYLNTMGKTLEACEMFERAFSISKNIQTMRNLELARRVAGKETRRKGK